jgi:hypothetical protein
MRAGRICATSCLAALAGPLAATAARAADLELRGPEGCADREQLAFHVSRLLGGPLERVPHLTFVADVSISQGGYEARLSVQDTEHPGRPSERSIHESTCPRLMEALGVVIVLAIHHVDGAPATHTAEAQSSGASPPPPLAGEGSRASSSASVEADSSLAAAVPDPAKLEPSVGAGLLIDAGALPDPGFGVSLSVELTRARLRLAAGGVLFPEQRVVLQGRGDPPAGADVGLALGSLAACYGPAGWEAELAVGACLRGEVGRLSGDGVHLSAPRSEARWWIAPGLDLLGSWNLYSALRLDGKLGATAPLSRPHFQLGELGELYRPAALTFRAGLGLAIVFE